MSSYAADLEAIFSAPYESVEGEDQMEEETARPREEVAAPLMTSTPHVKGGNSPASTDSAYSPRDQYETMEEGDREAPSGLMKQNQRREDVYLHSVTFLTL